jgi:two-component system nitrate/nitrite response regulator NarL
MQETTSKVIRGIRERLPSAIIVVIGETEPLVVLGAFRAGANGYLREAMTSQTLVMALQLALHEEIILPPEAAHYLLGRIGSSVGAVHPNESQQSLEAQFSSDSSVCLVPDEDEELLQKVILRAEPHLSAREVVILKGLADGLPNKVIAKTLAITEATVKVHVKAVLRKIQARNRTQAAVWAVRNLPPSSMRH